ncbi:MAG: AAA family ATPase, partial [Acidobacteriales bacterium]|nr:AAA family ATPase [Terriglobales bacterium]
MLKLKKLQILGFKSFCDRTELKFHGDGIAAIIGPNGCGKSNIADAISWVLGEQSAKTLRGSRMEDVIFAGTGERKPTGMAEVSLTLIDPEVYAGPDAHEATEIEIRDPESGAFEDWDESALRSDAAAETERLTEEVQPGPGIEPSEIAATEKDHPQVEGPEAEGLQVVLKIRRRKFQQQRPEGEIVVTRRLFRTGESEYLLNGKLCRLRDIQELFMGTGLGPESYALIEQGRIGQILSSRPTDRRAIIEEAAGITKFKAKKRLAEARLEDAKQNLARVNDIFEEVTRQMNSLKRQASKAERHAKLRDEIRARLRTVLASKFALLDRERTEVNTRIAALTQEMDLQIEAVQTREAEHAQSMQRGYAIETDLRENRERLNQVKREIERAKSQRQHNQERCAELTARSASSEAELAQTARRLSTLEADLASHRLALESAANELAAAQHLLASSQEEVTAAGTALSELESRQEQYRSNTIETAAAVSDLRNQLTQTTERMAAATRESERLMQQIAAIDSQMAAFGGRRGQLALEFETASQHMAGLTAEITKARDAIADRRREEADVKNHLDGLRTEFATILGKKASLEAVIAEHGYSTESVRRLFQSGVMNGGLAPVGVLADFLEVEGRYEGVVEDFLRDELNYVVVKSWDAADEGLRLLRTDVDGRATFLVHPEDSQAKFSFLAGESERPNPTDQSIVPLKQTIRVLDGFGKSLEVILPKLRDGYIVPDPSFARALALENPDAFFLSQSGECFHNVTVTGGRQRSEGPLSMKRELRDVVRISGELEAALGQQELRILELGRELKELNSLHDRLEDEKREFETQTMSSK